MQGIKTVWLAAKTATAKELRQFGLLFSGVLAGIFYFFVPWLKAVDRPSAVLWVALGLGGAAILLPAVLRPIFLLATLVGKVLGAVNNRIILSFIFFFIFSPMALVMRFFAKEDPMRATFDSTAPTYRILRKDVDLVKNKEKAF